MSHFAKVKDGLVEDVIVADQGYIDKLPLESGVTWVQTSYNTAGGVHYGQDKNPDGGVALRKNFAGISDIYDAGRDAFYQQKLWPSHILNEDTCIWEPPVPDPNPVDSDGLPLLPLTYVWDEDQVKWVEID
jgi:hypothetical protein|tara:strand:+ start:989 stop:1381 length:393 start_codon:yes stop_codon:yes gene_type:complete